MAEMKEIEVSAYAKINLSLDVEDLLPNGYHQVSMVMQQVELSDLVNVKWLPAQDKTGELQIEIGSNRSYLPADSRNLAWQAAAILHREFCPGGGKIRIDLKKQIPVGAGLAGGSANAAAVLHALCRLWDIAPGLDRLCALGEKLGADVPFCLLGQDPFHSNCYLAKGIGTELSPITGIDAWVVLSKPPISVSTAAVYKGYDQLADKSFPHPDTKMLLQALEESDMKKIAKNMVNVLENFTLKAYPSVVYTKNKMNTETEALAVVMSGSGPTVYGIYQDKSAAEQAYDMMRGVNRETFLTKTIW